MACNKFSTFILLSLAVRMCLAQNMPKCKADGLECLKKAMPIFKTVENAKQCPKVEEAYTCFLSLKGCTSHDILGEIQLFMRLAEDRGCDPSGYKWYSEVVTEMENDGLKMLNNECETKRSDCVEKSFGDETPLEKASLCLKIQEAYDCITRIDGNCEKGDAGKKAMVALAKDKKCDTSKYGKGTSEGATTKPHVAILLLSAILFLFAL